MTTTLLNDEMTEENVRKLTADEVEIVSGGFKVSGLDVVAVGFKVSGLDVVAVG